MKTNTTPTIKKEINITIESMYENVTIVYTNLDSTTCEQVLNIGKTTISVLPNSDLKISEDYRLVKIADNMFSVLYVGTTTATEVVTTTTDFKDSQSVIDSTNDKMSTTTTTMLIQIVITEDSIIIPKALLQVTSGVINLNLR